MPINIKNAAQIEKLRQANVVVCKVLDELEGLIKPGISTGEIGRRAAALVDLFGVKPLFLGYGYPPYPAVICVSVNDEVVHGIPDERRYLVEGDIVSLDFGVAKDGYCGDSARTIPVGNVKSNARKLMDVTRESLEKAIAQCLPGNRISDISRAVQEHVEAHGFSVVRTFVGHGIGQKMHEEPSVPNYVGPGKNPRLKAGMVLAIEPMVNEGTYEVMVDERDHWTARTCDGKLSAHFEHSVAIREDGPYVLSRI